MRDLHHPKFLQTRLYRSRRVERVGHFLYALFAGALLFALAAGIKSLRQM